MQSDSTPGVRQPDGRVEIQVPNKRISRLIQLGVHSEKAEKQKAALKRRQKLSRRRNRKR